MLKTHRLQNIPKRHMEGKKKPMKCMSDHSIRYLSVLASRSMFGKNICLPIQYKDNHTTPAVR